MANSVHPDQMPHSVASDLGVHCLLRPVCCNIPIFRVITVYLFLFLRGAFHAKNSGLTKEVAFDVPTYVLSHMMRGQWWPDGDELYHRWLNMPTLLLHGKYDKFITLQEEIQMSKVRDNFSHVRHNGVYRALIHKGR